MLYVVQYRHIVYSGIAFLKKEDVGAHDSRDFTLFLDRHENGQVLLLTRVLALCTPILSRCYRVFEL